MERERERESEFTDSCISGPVELPLGRDGGKRGESMGGRRRMQHVLISANKDVVSLFFSLLSPSARRGKEVLPFCATFVLWPAERPSGKLEWAGGKAISSIKCRSVSSAAVYFLFICRMSDMDTSVASRSSHRFVLCLYFPPQPAKQTSSYAHMEFVFVHQIL